MVIPERKWYACSTCKLEMIPDSEVKSEIVTSLQGKIFAVKIHKKCGQQVSEFDWRKH